MSTDITGTIKVALTLENKRELDLSDVIDALNIRESTSITFGTGASQVNVLYHDTITLADGADSTLNLYDSGTLTDSFGVALTMTALKFLYIKNNSTDATLLLFGGASADIPVCVNNSDIVKVMPSSTFYWQDISAAGTDITTNKNLKIAHNGTGSSTMAVDIVIGGLD